MSFTTGGETLVDFTTFERAPSDCVEVALKGVGGGATGFTEPIQRPVEDPLWRLSFSSALPPMPSVLFDFGPGLEEEEDEEDGNPNERWRRNDRGIDIPRGGEGVLGEAMGAGIRVTEEEVDEEMEAFLRDCAMTPPAMEQHPWDAL